jgi:uncharacterized protein YabE (DUF348 family)
MRALLVAGVVVVASITPALAAVLAPKDIQSTFFNGQPFTSSTMSNVKFKMVFTPDGKMTREPAAKTGAKAEGTWKLRPGRVPRPTASASRPRATTSGR